MNASDNTPSAPGLLLVSAGSEQASGGRAAPEPDLEGLARCGMDVIRHVLSVEAGADAPDLDGMALVVIQGLDPSGPVRDLIGRARAAGIPVLHTVGAGERQVDGRAAERVQALEDRLTSARRMEIVGRLVGGVTHDFNNVLSVVITLSELLLRFGPEDDPNREDMEEIHKAARRGSELTRQLQAFTRADVGTPQPVDLDTRLSGAEKLLRKLLPEDITVAVQPGGGGIVPVLMHPVEVDQILFNLAAHGRAMLVRGGSLRLAVEATAAGDPRVVLDLAPRPRGGAAGAEAVTGSETTEGGAGAGVAAAAAADEGPATVGTMDAGVPGLAAVEEIVARRGGRLNVMQLGEGASRVEVELPRAAEDIDDFDIDAEGLPAGHGEAVLVVEDDERVRLAVVRVLGALGYEASGVGAAGEALERIVESPPAAVVCDVVLRDAWGEELLERVTREYPGMPFLFVSGYQSHPALDGVRRSRHPLIRKPVVAATLANAVARVIGAASNPTA